MKAQQADVIGDIHGNAKPLRKLLLKLGYIKKPFGAWSHPEGRFVVFLGDFVDRGPQIRETLHIVRSLCETGNGMAVIGNHEHNALCLHYRDTEGNPIREHTPRNLEGTRKTREQFEGHQAEWLSHLNWFQSLPMSIDFGELRVVHACWDTHAIETLKGASLADMETLQISRKKSNPVGKAILRVLNGPELSLPTGMTLTDKEGSARGEVRVRWWDMEKGMTLGECIFPKTNPQIDKPIQDRHLNKIRLYGENEPLVCFGHYWLEPKLENVMVRKNLACLDLSIAKGGKIACLRHSMGTGENPHQIITQ